MKNIGLIFSCMSHETESEKTRKLKEEEEEGEEGRFGVYLSKLIRESRFEKNKQIQIQNRPMTVVSMETLIKRMCFYIK